MSFTDLVLTAFDTPATDVIPVETALPAKKRHSKQYLEFFKPADTPMEIQFPNFSYPQPRDEAGKHFWATLHNIAATYPDRPSSIKKSATRVMLKQLIKSFPCDNCKEHALSYMHENPPNLRNKSAFSRYMCEFHNTVNRHLGKPLFRCDVLSTQADTEECDTCKVLPMKKSNNTAQHIHIHHDDEPSVLFQAGEAEDETPALLDKENSRSSALIAGDTMRTGAVHDDKEEDIPAGEVVKEHFEVIKGQSKAIIEELCAKANIPSPEIVFGSCPSNMENSCTQVVLGNGIDDARGRIYLNPAEYSPRSILHEFKHYYNAVKSNDAEKFKDEDDAEVFARDAIKKFFPRDNVYGLPMLDQTQQQVLVAEDKKKPIYELPRIDTGRERLKAYLDPTHKWDFETLYEKSPKKEEPKPMIDFAQFGKPSPGGIAEWFDNIYGTVADTTGVPVQVLNDANTPEILGYSTNALQDLILSPFGRVLSSTLVGLGLYGIGVMSGDIATRDRRLIFEYASHHLWSFLQLAGNSPASQAVFTGATAFGTAIGKFDINAVLAALKK